MICPQCSSKDNRVLETRMQKEGGIRRRRECLECLSRFTTVETLLKQYPYVIKKDGSREPYNCDKLRRGLQLACLKRPVSLPQLEDIVDRISSSVTGRHDREVETMELGQKVMAELKNLDDVAYVRFASVYRTFQDVQEFVNSLNGEATPHGH